MLTRSYLQIHFPSTQSTPFPSNPLPYLTNTERNLITSYPIRPQGDYMMPLRKEHVKLIQEKNFGFLATLNQDGSPQVTPVWIDTDGEFLLVNTAIGRVKERNTRRDPRVAVSIADQGDPYSWITVNGKVTEWIEGTQAEEHIDKLAKKYTGAKKFTKSNPKERRIIFKIKPKRVMGWT